MTNVDYRFTQNDEGNLVFRSTVNSFGLENITDKDISSFYQNFSNYSYFDTGLLPVNGTGLLSIRSAGNHMQVAYQYEPGMYRINWGSYEHDSSAQAYHVAQPYRIVIGDFIDGNFYGARLFYTIEPVTHPTVELYHVNLPNINCRGYRGNGVGWVCLYHTHNVTSYPFNEKLIYLLDRCSGAEAYNDQNMSETDGPRFYKSYYSDSENYSYLWDPSEWQNKSQEEGYEWTLNSNLWAPIIVQGIDNQDKHDPNGIPLTMEMAIFGDYAAYYNDPHRPKPTNAMARSDIELSNSKVFGWFKQSYNNSSVELKKVNSFEASTEIKANNITNPIISATGNSENSDDDVFTCEMCECQSDTEEAIYVEWTDAFYCSNCISDSFVYSEVSDAYLPVDEAVLCSSIEEYYHPNDPNYKYLKCDYCGSTHVATKMVKESSLNLYKDLGCCSVCISNIEEHENTKCGVVGCNIAIPFDDKNKYSDSKALPENSPNGIVKYACNHHAQQLTPWEKNCVIDENPFETLGVCLCGNVTPIKEFSEDVSVLLHGSIIKPDNTNISFDLEKKYLEKIITNYSNVADNAEFGDTIALYSYVNKVCSDCIEHGRHLLIKQTLAESESIVEKIEKIKLIFSNIANNMKDSDNLYLYGTSFALNNLSH